MRAISPAHEIVHDVFAGAFKGAFQGHVWAWADEHVYFSEKMAAEASHYDSSMTPWSREWQDLPLDQECHEGSIMKSSQTGATEAVLNVIRWMPDNWPGNVGYIINSQKKAQRLSKVRLRETLMDCAEDQVSDDPNDASTYHIILRNMEISISGSGSANAFRETWYRLGVLDEPEDHETQGDGTTSYDNIQTRFTTVSDSLLYVLGKPQEKGGIIHRCFLKGSQEKYLVPCPHCHHRIELLFDNLQFSHCKDLVGQWDLERVIDETWYQCQICGGRIEEREKRSMVLAGRWVPTPEKYRERLDGRTIQAEPGVRSFHISDVYSLFPKVRWGMLAKAWLMAHKVAPNITAQNAFTTEHLGRPIEPQEMGFRDGTIEALRGGIVEEVNGRKVVHGKAFSLCYEHHEEIGPLPIDDPDYLSMTTDKQGDILKYVVFCWSRSGEAWPIDYGMLRDEEAMIDMRHRRYITPETGRLIPIFGGLVDSGYDRTPVFEACIKAQTLGFQLYPSRGEFYHSEYKGRSIYLKEQVDFTATGVPVDVWNYYDHSIKMDFYIGKVHRRDSPRLWMPDPVPGAFLAELTSEKLTMTNRNGRKKQEFVHVTAMGPNDYGDCFKMQYVFRKIVAEQLAAG
jgi:hypothetical protein